MSESLQLGRELLVATMSLQVKKRSKCRHGNPHLRKLLVQAAHGAKMKRGSFYRAKYNKLVFRLGSANKAKVAIANRLARAIYKILSGAPYKDIGYKRGDQVRRLVAQLKNLAVDIKHENHQMIINSVRKVKVDSTGIVIENIK